MPKSGVDFTFPFNIPRPNYEINKYVLPLTVQTQTMAEYYRIHNTTDPPPPISNIIHVINEFKLHKYNTRKSILQGTTSCNLKIRALTTRQEFYG